MRKIHPFLVPFACLLAACGPSESEVAEAARAKAARAAAQATGLTDAPLDLGEGLMLTVLQRGSGAFVPAGGRVRVHYDASVVAVARASAEQEPVEAAPAVAESTAAEPPAAEGVPVEGAAPTADAAGEGAAEPSAETASEAPENAAEPAPESDAPGTEEPAATSPSEALDAAAAPVEAAPDASGAAAAESGLPLRFDSSRARGVPDTWDLSRTASPRLIEGLRRGLVGLTAGSRVTLLVPAALAWGEEGLPGAKVPPRADVLYEIELIEVLP